MVKTHSNSWSALVAIGLFIFMSTLDATIVNIALPVLVKVFDVTSSTITYIVSFYVIVIASLLIFFGKLGDLFGKVKIFKIGGLIFLFASFLAGFEVNFVFLIATRILQAIGAAMTMSVSFGIVAEIFEPSKRTRAMSIVSVFVALGGVAGPAFGGLILHHAHWGYIFWINIPIGILAIILSIKSLPKDLLHNQQVKIDYLGCIIFSIFIISTFIGIDLLRDQGMNAKPLMMFLFSLLAFISFIFFEKKQSEPILNLEIFSNKLFTISVLASFLLFSGNIFANILLPFYLQDFKGLSPKDAGLIMMIWPLTMIFVSPIVGFLGDKYDKEKITLVGIFVVVIGHYGFMNISGQSSNVYIMFTTFLSACGASIFQAPNNALVMQNVEKKFLGVAGSVNALARNLGVVMGISLAVAILFNHMSSILNVRVDTYLPEFRDVFITAIQHTFTVSFAIVITTFLIVLTRLLLKPSN